MKIQTLKNCVSDIIGKDVSENEAKEFANNQFGVLCAYIKHNVIKNIVDDKKHAKKPAEFTKKRENYVSVLKKNQDDNQI